MENAENMVVITHICQFVVACMALNGKRMNGAHEIGVAGVFGERLCSVGLLEGKKMGFLG